MSDVKEDIKTAADAAEAVKSTADVAADAATLVANVTSKDKTVDTVIDGVKRAGKAYENISSQNAGNIMDKLFGGVTNIFKGLRKISKDVEDGGGPKILP